MRVAGESIAESWNQAARRNLSSVFRRIDSLPGAWYAYTVWRLLVLEVFAVFYCVAILVIEVC